jgi:hypothetical protein
MEARTGAIDSVAFAHFLSAYEPLISIANVRIFAKQAKAFQLLARREPECLTSADNPANQALGQCLATIAYAQLVAENALRLHLPAQMIAAIFHTLVSDFSTAALALASCGAPDVVDAFLVRRMVSVPSTSRADWDFVAQRMAGTSDLDRRTG